MKIIKVLFKIFIVSVLLVAVIIAGIALYVKFYGKDLLASALSNALGVRVKFENVSLNLDKYAVNFRGFSIPNKISFDEENIFNAEKFSMQLNKEKFEKERKVVVEKIIIKKGVLNIERDRKGVFNISYYNEPRRLNHENGIAYAGEPEESINIYNFIKGIKGLYIQDSTINFKDYYVPQGPFTISCDKFNVLIASIPQKDSRENAIPMICSVDFEIPGRYGSGKFSLEGDISLFKNKVDTDIEIHATNIDLMRFLPYFNSYTPFSFREGFFRSETKLTVRDNIVDSLTTMAFRRLRLLIDPGMENTQFLETSVNKLVPYLVSSRGEVIFDFVIRGPLDKPRIGVGPQVKYAIGLVVMEELSDMLQRLRK